MTVWCFFQLNQNNEFSTLRWRLFVSDLNKSLKENIGNFADKRFNILNTFLQISSSEIKREWDFLAKSTIIISGLENLFFM
jgi:hypothetical protein